MNALPVCAFLNAHTDASCSHCESMSLSSLCSWIAFFSESKSAPRALLSLLSQEPRRKKQWSQRAERPESSELMSAQILHASLSLHREISLVLFTHADQRPSCEVSSLVSFGGSEWTFVMTACHWQLPMRRIGRAQWMTPLLVRHLWLNLTEIKDADRTTFLDSLVSPNGLFGPAVDGFAEHFTEDQKSSQALRHFLPKHSSSAASGCQKTMPTKQPAAESQQHPHSAKCFAPKRQGPRPKIALDPAPQKQS